ncbi:hypothetical protein EDF60_0625 [Leucobacter luti]|uniref:hypothetical protein n=1 Tax=Leucobacter luti TaxID=340320 RepID=UPI00104781B9|nr:hypothetical protein [Leucobacter luti]MCW2288445.1 hypothetical protein [Leucobacter luti]TCK45398.1 hypothetical protein EDF60_0625 [Leucobacter luti]
MTRLAALICLIVVAFSLASAPAEAVPHAPVTSAVSTRHTTVPEQDESLPAALISVTGPSSMPVPGPGHETHAEFTVVNRTDTPLPLSFRISSDESALVTTGEDLSLTLSDGQERVLSAVLRDLNGASSTTVELAPLTPGESRVLRGALTLDQSAGNEYQDLSGNLRISFEATSETPRLAETGASRDPAAAVLALALAVGGVLLLTRRTPESTR